MSNEPHNPEPEKKPRRKKKRLRWSTIIAALVCLPVAWLCVRSGRVWLQDTRHESAIEHEIATLTGRNAVLKPAWEALDNKKFMICNKNPQPVTIHWLAAVYQDGRKLKLFDPQRCEAWRPQLVPSGAQKLINFSSPDEACNWSGSVIFFAMRYSHESADGMTSTFDDAGTWTFDRDCYTVN